MSAYVKWEYKVLSHMEVPTPADMARVLTILGDMGYELVLQDDVDNYIFKRRKVSREDKR